MVSLVEPVLYPLLGAASIIMVSIVLRGRERIYVVLSALSIGFSLYSLYQLSLQLPQSYILNGFAPPLGVELYADMFSIFMACLFCSLGLLASIYSTKYMSVDDGLEKFYSLLLMLVAGMTGVVLSGDLFTLFVFWELMCVSSYALVAFRKYRWEPIEAGFKYLVMSTIGSLIALYGISLLYGMTGTLNIHAVMAGMPMVWTPQGYFALAMIFAGFAVTGAVVPFHSWLPDAHPAAPSPVSALLSGVVIKVGIYAIFRILFTIFNPGLYNFGIILIIFGAISITVANIMVLPQRDIKRFLAFSSITNVGFILLAGGVAAYIMLFHPSSMPVAYMAMAGAIFHVLNHAVGKSLLFLASGNFIHEAKTRDLKELEGIGRKMPYTGVSFSLGLLSLAGVPPLGGFWSKFLIILA
ncbi:MAG: hypothetical protein LUP94_03705, partial [Candidatus Methanomethylicus sp.]|nr:hypothetical protein [Candidatus Methanomethylicus sp.]